MENGRILGAIGVYSLALTFGIFYNWAIGIVERRKMLEGLTWLQVVVGVAVTLALATILIGIEILWVIGAFAASGLPMAIGSLYRYEVARQNERKAERELP